MTAPVEETIESLRAERDSWKAKHSAILKKWTESTLAGCRWIAAYHDMRRKAELFYDHLQEQSEAIARLAKSHAGLASSGGGRGDGEEGGGAVCSAGKGAPVDKVAESEDEEDESDHGEDDQTVEEGRLLTTTHSE